MFGIKTVGFEVFWSVEVYVHCGFALRSEMLLGGLKQACANSLAFPLGFDIEPVECHLIRLVLEAKDALAV